MRENLIQPHTETSLVLIIQGKLPQASLVGRSQGRCPAYTEPPSIIKRFPDPDVDGATTEKLCCG